MALGWPLPQLSWQQRDHDWRKALAKCLSELSCLYIGGPVVDLPDARSLHNKGILPSGKQGYFAHKIESEQNPKG
jgi:hypothetical protein